MPYSTPANEAERLVAVHSLNILDTAPDVAYDEIGELAAQICRCPVAYVSFMDDDRLWLKAKYGLPPDFDSVRAKSRSAQRRFAEPKSSLRRISSWIPDSVRSPLSLTHRISSSIAACRLSQRQAMRSEPYVSWISCRII